MAKINAHVVGGGGREAIITRLLDESDVIGKLRIGPGNGGTHEFAENVDLKPDYENNCEKFIAYLKENDIGLVVSGSETDLVKGLGDIVRAEGIDFFGASKKAAKFEGDKIFARNFTALYGIPHPNYKLFNTDNFVFNQDSAVAYAEIEFEKDIGGLVLKAAGLCGGKGVTIAHNIEEFKGYVAGLEKFGDAGKKFLVEEMLEGVEVSVTVLVQDSDNYVILPYSQDYKREGEGDTGENTGGMGAVTVDLASELTEDIEKRIIVPTIKGAEHTGNSMKSGVLYIGLMITKEGPKVLEYNIRFGDPESQVVLKKIKSDFGELILRTAKGELAEYQPEFDDEQYATVIMAAKGYPSDYKASEGKLITGIEKACSLENVIVNIAGTTFKDGQYFVKGSRNINVIGCGETQEQALERAYAGAACIESEGLYRRTDIGCNLKAINDLKKHYR